MSGAVVSWGLEGDTFYLQSPIKTSQPLSEGPRPGPDQLSVLFETLMVQVRKQKITF